MRSQCAWPAPVVGLQSRIAASRRPRPWPWSPGTACAHARHLALAAQREHFVIEARIGTHSTGPSRRGEPREGAVEGLILCWLGCMVSPPCQDCRQQRLGEGPVPGNRTPPGCPAGWISRCTVSHIGMGGIFSAGSCSETTPRIGAGSEIGEKADAQPGAHRSPYASGRRAKGERVRRHRVAQCSESCRMAWFAVAAPQIVLQQIVKLARCAAPLR